MASTLTQKLLQEASYSFVSAHSNCNGVVWDALEAGGLGQYHNVGDSWFIQGAADLLKAVTIAKTTMEQRNRLSG
jgi:hypothetical protein